VQHVTFILIFLRSDVVVYIQLLIERSNYLNHTIHDTFSSVISLQCFLYNRVLQNHRRKPHIAKGQCSCIQQTCTILWTKTKKLEISYQQEMENWLKWRRNLKLHFNDYLRVLLVPCLSIRRCF